MFLGIGLILSGLGITGYSAMQLAHIATQLFN